jgi:uncharacterized membrane protein YqaE (UPF0057 family)
MADWVSRGFDRELIDVFRLLVVLLVSAGDCLIAWILWRKTKFWISLLFLFNPVSALISGYHNQFDNLAVLLALSGALLLDRHAAGGRRGDFWGGLIVLSLCLCLKHIFIFFPLWVALKQRGLCDRAVALLLPICLFVLGFVPFWALGADGIVDNVLLYRSFDNAPGLRLFIPGIFLRLLSADTILILAMGVAALWYRRQSTLRSAMAYTLVLLIFAPAVANQYLAIPVAAMCASLNGFYGLYLAIGGPFLMANGSGPGADWIVDLLPGFMNTRIAGGRAYDVMIAVLAAGFFWQHCGHAVQRTAKRVWRADRPMDRVRKLLSGEK